MKKLILFLIFGLSVSLHAQTTYWPPNTQIGTFDSIKCPVAADTVKSLAALGNVNGYWSIWEFDMSRMDSSVSVTFGGGLRVIRVTPRMYSFNSIQCDSVPYILSRLKYRTTTNGVAQNTKTLQITSPFGNYYAAIKVKRLGCTSGKYLLFNVLFYKP